MFFLDLFAFLFIAYALTYGHHDGAVFSTVTYMNVGWPDDRVFPESDM